MQIQVSLEEVVEAQKRIISDMQHELVLNNIVVNKLSAENEQFREMLGMSLQPSPVESMEQPSLGATKRPQTARQVAPGLNGHGAVESAPETG